MKKLVKSLFLFMMFFTVLIIPITSNAKTYRKTVKIYVGQKQKLEYKGIAFKNSKWEISNPSLIKISNGYVVAKKAGTTKATCTYKKNKYVFTFKINTTKYVKLYFGKYSGIGLTFYSFSKDKVVWKLKNNNSSNVWIIPLYFQLGNKIYYLENQTEKIIAPHSSRTFTFIRSKDFEEKIDMNSHYAGFYWQQF